MKRIYLTGKHSDKFVIVDDLWHKKLTSYRWHYQSGYASTCINGKNVYMHRMVASTPSGMHTDHKNHNKLDNRRENLRVCTRAENMQNRRKRRGCVKRFTTKGNTYWIGELRKNGHRFRSTTCKTAEMAEGALKQMIIDREL